ncbi:APC family permease [Pendulispora rubella]|uniref:APC family permease n=1 Tax=Pendulispora rubella TaxID=2741070 RepID=A0ABZ2KXR6_9BACT
MTSRGTLLRVLGVGFGLAVTIGNTVGAGILRTPGEVAAQLPHTALFLAVWVIGGIYALLGAVSLSELGAAIPRSGGYYVFAHRAFGDFAGFVVGWTDWLAQCGSLAATAIVVGEYVCDLAPALGGRHTHVALATVAIVSLLQARGIRWGSFVQNASSAAKALVFALLLLAFFAWAPPRTDPTVPLALPSEPMPLAVAMLIALQAVIYTYDGWYGVIYFGEEVRAPARDVPRSMIGGVLSIMALYLLVNAALVRVVPVEGLAGQTLAMGTATHRVFGERGAVILRVVAIVSMISAINAYQLMGSRTPLAMGRDRLLPEAFTRVNEGGTPALGLLCSAGAAALFILTGSFQQIAAVMAFFFVANYVMAFLAVFVLRRREPRLPRPYRAWGYPYTTGLALLVSVAFLIAAVLGDPRNSVSSLLVLAASYPVYRLVRRFG